MQANSSQPKRFLSNRAMTIYAALFLCLFQLQSCAPSSTLEGSFDMASEHEGGPSALKDADDVGFNVALKMMWGVAGIPHQASGDWKRGAEVASDAERAIPAYDPAGRTGNDAGGKWMFGPTLQLIRKGSKFQGSTTHLLYMEVLGDIIYQYPMKDGGTLFGGAGPYIGYGLGGKVNFGGTKENAFGGDDGYKRFDAGLHLMAGYALPSTLEFSLGYEFGLVNKSPAPDFTSKNRALSFNVGYSLDKIIGGFRKK